jgi:hypothetical protein
VIFLARLALLLTLIQCSMDQRFFEMFPLAISALFYPNPFLALVFFLLRSEVDSSILALILSALLFLSNYFRRSSFCLPRIELKEVLIFISVFFTVLMATTVFPISNLVMALAVGSLMIAGYRPEWRLLRVAYFAAGISLSIILLQSYRPLPEMYKIYERNNPSLFGVYDVEHWMGPAGLDEMQIRQPEGSFLNIRGLSWLSDNGRILIHPLSFVIHFTRHLLGQELGEKSGVLVSGSLTEEICDLFKQDSAFKFFDSHLTKVSCSEDEMPSQSNFQHQIVFDGAQFRNPENLESTWLCQMSSAFEMSQLSKADRFDQASLGTFTKGEAWFPVGKRMLCFVRSRSEAFLARRAQLDSAARARYFDWEYPW